MKREIITRIEEHAALYALGMLHRTEALDFEQELSAGNQEAALSLMVFDHLVADLALSVAEASPSARVRTALLNRIAGESGFAPSMELDGTVSRA